MHRARSRGADRTAVFWGRTRPVLVTGLPGISVPAYRRAVISRVACDLFLLHSKREVAEFAEIGALLAPRLVFGLAPLPFLPTSSSERVPDAQLGSNLVFAARRRCHWSEPTGKRSCWHWPTPGLP